MNKAILIGRLCSDPELSLSQSGTSIAKYTLAVDRRYKKEGEQSADFIRCIAFGKSAEFVGKFLEKGVKIAVTGRIQTGSYENQDGKTVYTTDIVVEEHFFCEGKKSSGTPAARASSDNDFEFAEYEGAEDDIPF